MLPATFFIPVRNRGWPAIHQASPGRKALECALLCLVFSALRAWLLPVERKLEKELLSPTDKLSRDSVFQTFQWAKILREAR